MIEALKNTDGASAGIQYLFAETPLASEAISRTRSTIVGKDRKESRRRRSSDPTLGNDQTKDFRCDDMSDLFHPSDHGLRYSRLISLLASASPIMTSR